MRFPQRKLPFPSPILFTGKLKNSNARFQSPDRAQPLFDSLLLPPSRLHLSLSAPPAFPIDFNYVGLCHSYFFVDLSVPFDLESLDTINYVSFI